MLAEVVLVATLYCCCCPDVVMEACFGEREDKYMVESRNHEAACGILASTGTGCLR